MVEVESTILKPKCADTIYFGGDILTMEGDSPIYAEAIALKDGVILSVGEKSEVEKSKGATTKLVDLQGKTLLPGFIDGHSHLFIYLANMDFAKLNPPPIGSIRNIADINRALKEKKTELKLSDTDWLIGWGYDQTALQEQRHPTAVDLDAVFPTNPVLIMHVTGHMLVANTAAMKAKGITSETKNPPGGIIVRKPGSQEPEGLFQETAYEVFFDEIIKKQPLEVAVQKLQKALAYYSSCGLTTTHEGLMQLEQMPLAEYAATNGQLFIDLVCLIFISLPREKLMEQNAVRWGEYNNGLKYIGVKNYY
jgi:predicted amidohydrolase YtcJ